MGSDKLKALQMGNSTGSPAQAAPVLFLRLALTRQPSTLDPTIKWIIKVGNRTGMELKVGNKRVFTDKIHPWLHFYQIVPNKICLGKWPEM